MEAKELIQALRADAEWAHGNERETPITLGDHLDAAIDALDAADKAQRWIPVSERLPEEYKEKDVLTYDSLGNIEGFEADNINLWNEHHIDQQITHWQPLPQPPKEGELWKG